MVVLRRLFFSNQPNLVTFIYMNYKNTDKIRQNFDNFCFKIPKLDFQINSFFPFTTKNAKLSIALQ